jgi:hypothetical protein
MNRNEYLALVYEHLDAIELRQHFQKSSAVILERLARGGGATNWFFCKTTEDLAAIFERLKPGSLVSFYFDDRIRQGWYSEQLDSEIESFIAEDGDCMVGFLGDDGRSIEVDFPGGPGDLKDFVAICGTTRPFFYGRFPGPDNDGKVAFTVTLPDRDGVVRRHPY